MRNRFFFIILTALVLAAVGINLVHVYFFKSQRLNLIDQQIRESSDLLLTSSEFENSLKQPQSLEDQITKILGGSRIGKVFLFRDPSGKILYQSGNLNSLQVEFPTNPEWVTVEVGNQFVRLRNIHFKNVTASVLQVGLVMDRNFINWEILDARVARYIAGIVIALFAASAFVTFLLLSPLRLLISHLARTTTELGNLRDVEPLPGVLTKYTAGFLAKSDEFSDLINAIKKLIDRINLNHKLTRAWTLQMAHELKTPLAVVTALAESNLKTGKIPEQLAKDIATEVMQMSTMINDFLDWAELENSQPQKDLHSLKVGKAAQKIATRVENIEPGRIHLQVRAECSVFANPAHLDQLVTNLVTNALKYSGERPIEILLVNRTLLVRDQGPGIPKEVLERLGEPFNVGSSENGKPVGNGLGLAWVTTVAKLYGWKVELKPTANGTEATVFFAETRAI